MLNNKFYKIIIIIALMFVCLFTACSSKDVNKPVAKIGLLGSAYNNYIFEVFSNKTIKVYISEDISYVDDYKTFKYNNYIEPIEFVLTKKQYISLLDNIDELINENLNQSQFKVSFPQSCFTIVAIHKGNEKTLNGNQYTDCIDEKYIQTEMADLLIKNLREITLLDIDFKRMPY